MNEDVYPIKNGDFPTSHVGFAGCVDVFFFTSWEFCKQFQLYDPYSHVLAGETSNI